MQIQASRAADVVKSQQQVWLTTLMTSASHLSIEAAAPRRGAEAWSLSGINDTPARTGDTANIISYTCTLESARPSGDWFTMAILNEYIHVYAIF